MYWIYLWFVRSTTEIEKKKLRKKNSFDTQSIVGISLFALFTIRSSAIQQTKKKVRKAYRFPISFMLFSNIFTIGLTMLTVGVTNHIRCFLIFFCHSFSMLLCLLDRFFLLFYVFFLYKKCVCRCLSKWFLYVNVIFCSRWKYEKTTTKIINKKYWKWFAKFYLKKKNSIFNPHYNDTRWSHRICTQRWAHIETFKWRFKLEMRRKHFFVGVLYWQDIKWFWNSLIQHFLSNHKDR